MQVIVKYSWMCFGHCWFLPSNIFEFFCFISFCISLFLIRIYMSYWKKTLFALKLCHILFEKRAINCLLSTDMSTPRSNANSFTRWSSYLNAAAFAPPEFCWPSIMLTLFPMSRLAVLSVLPPPAPPMAEMPEELTPPPPACTSIPWGSVIAMASTTRSICFA